MIVEILSPILEFTGLTFIGLVLLIFLIVYIIRG